MVLRRSDRERLVWSFLISVLLNVIGWAWLAGHGSLLIRVHENAPRETLTVSSTLHIERRVTHRQYRQRKPQVLLMPPAQTGPMAPPLPATLALPRGWARQDFGYLETTDTSEWLDWKNQSAKWVPRVFLWRFKAGEGYMSRPSLRDKIREILSTLHDEHAKLYVSRSQTVCDGQRAGWFLSYVKTSDDPPLRFDETLFMDGDTVYRATYIRAADQPEDSETRQALNTLCS